MRNVMEEEAHIRFGSLLSCTRNQMQSAMGEEARTPLEFLLLSRRKARMPLAQSML
jgi:hypothetical protein